MHVCQIMLVEADDGKDAISMVQSLVTYSEDPYPTWSDWHEIGGRWDGLFEGWEENRNSLGYTENPALAEDILKEFSSFRKTEMEKLFAEITAKGLDIGKMIENYNAEDFDYGTGMDAWTLARLGKLLSNDWCSDTGVFDLVESSANLRHFRERLAKEPSKQFLVPVDFHY